MLNTLPVMLFVFRLVCAPRRQGYTTTLAQLWAQCRALNGSAGNAPNRKRTGGQE